MSDNIKDLFKGYQGCSPAIVNRVCNQVMRNGIIDMDNLCRILKEEPERLMKMRNIGIKSIEVICAVCSAHTSEKGGAN